MKAVLYFGVTVSAALGSEKNFMTLEQAICVGNKYAAGMGTDLQTVVIRIDDNNKEWEEYVPHLRNSSVGELKAPARRYDSALAGHKFWPLLYDPKRIGDRALKGGGATILVDKKTGEILLGIRSE